MKHIFIGFISLISLVSFAQEIQPELKGWAKNSVNTVVFRNNAIVSFDNLQFMAYYDDEGFLCLAKRVLNSATWTMKKTAYKGNVQDAHNCISIMVDGDGYLHVAWGHHNSPLNYAKSRDAQLDVSTSLDLEEKQAMTGQQENKLTYPGFYKLSNGNLLFLYREGGSGNGNLVVNTYDIHTKKWTQLHDNLISGEGFRNAYWQACTDTKGNIHLSWVWRETPDVATNHDMCYARSTDGGKTWTNSKGKKYALPITEKSAEYAAIIPQKSELINQTSMTADNAGNPYIATFYRKPDSQIPQYHIIFLKNNKWLDVSLDFRKTPFTLSGGGTKKIPIARPQILFSNNEPVLIFRDEERGSKVSLAICKNFPESQWRITDVTDYSVGDWEPTYDTELWKTRQQLDVFIQKTEQKDNEGTAEIAAQPVSVLNIPLENLRFKSWAQIPPMGWNSWDCYGPTVEEHEVKANADYMAKKLKKYGWEYIVVDIRWFVENDKAGGYNQTDPRYVMDEWGRYLPALNRFPSAADNKGFKPLADYVHAKGLKFGIHIMRGIPKEAVARKLPVHGTNGITADQIYSLENQCKWLKDNYTIVKSQPGAQEYYNSIMELYASWGVDFIKIDDLSAPIYHEDEIDMIRKAIDLTGRPIVLSTSPGETPFAAAEHVSAHANMWRMVNDVWDEWRDLPHLMKVAQDWYPYIASGTWPDCDMIPLGRISIRGERGKDRMTRLTKDEQYSLMTFFTILRSPLMFGGDLPSNDSFTLSLLTNKEVLKMHREATGVRQLFQQDGKLAVTSHNAKTGERYLALFNISDHPEPMNISVKLSDLGISDKCKITNMWTGKAFEKGDGEISAALPAHASMLLSIKKK